LVAPGVPKGTPAISTTDWPAVATLARSAMRRALATISSKLPTSRVWTACEPHSSPSRRAVEMFGVSTSIGTLGRSRDTRRAVPPVLVKQTIVAAEMVSTISAEAAAIASAVV
jgi:hypothetical protein